MTPNNKGLSSIDKLMCIDYSRSLNYNEGVNVLDKHSALALKVLSPVAEEKKEAGSFYHHFRRVTFEKALPPIPEEDEEADYPDLVLPVPNKEELSIIPEEDED